MCLVTVQKLNIVGEIYFIRDSNYQQFLLFSARLDTREHVRALLSLQSVFTAHFNHSGISTELLTYDVAMTF